MPSLAFLDAELRRETEESCAIRRSWYLKLSGDELLRRQLKRLVEVRNNSAYDRASDIEVQGAEALWDTWVTEKQLTICCR